ncbi:MAG: exostosin family protein [Bacteroidota bacterium]
MIKVYTDTTYLTQEYRKIIFPVLLDIHFLKAPNALENFQIIEELENADVVIVPVAINYFFKHKKQQELNQFIDKALAANKKVWVYSAGDFGITFRKHVTVFRLGGFKSKLSKNEEIMPLFVSDPYTYVLNTNWFFLDKTEKPTIGFVGNANGSFLKKIKEILIFFKLNFKRQFDKSIGDYQSFFSSSSVRYSVLKDLEKSQSVICNFIYRNSYRGGAQTENQKKQSTLEFFQNIENNLYTICIRGAGNFSVRLYETLMMGRIPVVVQSDAKLPLENTMNWQNHAVLVNRNTIIEEVIAFHNKFSNEEIIEIQKNNRNLMLNLFLRVNYFKKIYTLQNEF